MSVNSYWTVLSDCSVWYLSLQLISGLLFSVFVVGFTADPPACVGFGYWFVFHSHQQNDNKDYIFKLNIKAYSPQYTPPWRGSTNQRFSWQSFTEKKEGIWLKTYLWCIFDVYKCVPTSLVNQYKNWIWNIGGCKYNLNVHMCSMQFDICYQ